MMPAPRISPAECFNCQRARKRGTLLCYAHWTRFEEWMTRFDRRGAWDGAQGDKEAMTALMIEWRRWEREQDNDLREKCPTCGSEAMMRGACPVCGHGVRFGARPVARKRVKRKGRR